MSSHADASDRDDVMHRRRTTMPDGRYLYYYTFGEDAGTGHATTPADSSAPGTKDGDQGDHPRSEEQDV